MNARQLKSFCEKMIRDGHGDLEVVAMHGASGVSYPLHQVGVSEADEYEQGHLCNYGIGEKYIMVACD
jgi:hypothetical protein